LWKFRVRLAIVGLGVSLALGIVAPQASAAANGIRRAPPRLIYHKSRSFRVPFNVDPNDQARLKEVQLWFSDDEGYTWKRGATATPNRPFFTFKALRDGEYWFAVRTLDSKGKLYPSDDDEVEPKMKVLVDSVPPTLRLDPAGRKGTMASVRWEVKDDHLDLKSLVLEYQLEGVREWRRIPKVQPALIGSARWDAGTAEPLHVRASISDRAGNTAEEVVSLPEGSAPNPGAFTNEFNDTAPPISQISSGPSFPPVEDNLRAGEGAQDPPPAREAESVNSASGANESDPFQQAASPKESAPAEGAGEAPAPGRRRSLLVSNPRFPLKYAVDDAGPDGPSSVELWVTQDRGGTWVRQGEDADRVSPFPVDLGGEGTFGLCLVARSAFGLGDNPPMQGDPPQFWVEVDQTRPDVQLQTRLGTGKFVGQIAIDWVAKDLHLPPRPVQLFWRADQNGSRWFPITPQPIENKSPYVWTVPANIPPRFHIRVEVIDEAGNRGFADTTESGPITFDRTRPRSRIIGLDDPSPRAGAGNPPSSMR